jgi:hypothetical protein
MSPGAPIAVIAAAVLGTLLWAAAAASTAFKASGPNYGASHRHVAAYRQHLETLREAVAAPDPAFECAWRAFAIPFAVGWAAMPVLLRWLWWEGMKRAREAPW